MTIDANTDRVVQRATWNGSLYYFLLFIAAGCYGPFLYVHFADIGLSGKQIGWIATLGPVVMMLLSMPLAALADRFHLRKRFTQLAIIGTCITVFLLKFSSTFLNIVLVMLAIAIFNSASQPIAESLIARTAQRYGLNFGTMRLWGSMGYAVSALTFGVVWQRFGFGYMFFVGSFLLLPLIWLAGMLEDIPPVDRLSAPSAFSLLQDRGLLLLIVATFLAAISNSLAMTFSGIYARSLGGGNFIVGLMIAVSAFAELPAMFYNEHLARILRAPNTIILANLLMALGFVGYIYTPTPNLIPLFSIIKGMGYGLWITLTVRTVTRRTPDQWGATAQSLVTVSTFGLAPLVANPIGGWLNDMICTRAVFWLGVVTLVFASVLLMMAIKWKDIE